MILVQQLQTNNNDLFEQTVQYTPKLLRLKSNNNYHKMLTIEIKFSNLM